MNDMEHLIRSDPFQLVAVLMHSGRYTEARLDAVLGAVGLSSAKWLALKHLHEAETALPLSQLAEKLACVRSNATQLVDRLEAEHLVRRVPDPEDRRSVRAEITPEGVRRFEAGQEAVCGLQREMLGDYTDEERVLLGKLLARLEQAERSLG